jgi:hypothetical protein
MENEITLENEITIEEKETDNQKRLREVLSDALRVLRPYSYKKGE